MNRIVARIEHVVHQLRNGTGAKYLGKVRLLHRVNLKMVDLSRKDLEPIEYQSGDREVFNLFKVMKYNNSSQLILTSQIDPALMSPVSLDSHRFDLVTTGLATAENTDGLIENVHFVNEDAVLSLIND